MLKFFKKVVFSRSFMTALLIILQLLFWGLIGNVLIEYSTTIQVISYILSTILAIYILGLKNGSLDVKLPWVIFILLFPVFGSLFYFFFRNQRVRKKIRLNVESQAYAIKNIAHTQDNVFEELKESNRTVYNQSMYLFKTTNLPIYKNTTTTYFEFGQDYFKALIEELKKANKFIFMEYFILRPGRMFNEVVEILKEKANNGVEVRVIYDDFGCINTLPQKYRKEFEKNKIKCEVFNPIYPITTLAHNNRDHRKIVVIDGVVGFTGGINLGDEYINEASPYGIWKDTGVMLKGEAVKSFTLLFLEIWHIYRDKNEDYLPYLPKIEIIRKQIETKKEKKKRKSKKKTTSYNDINVAPTAVSAFDYQNMIEESEEYVQPYATTPMDPDEIVARNVYVNILNSANDYVYITTPYLILDPELEEAIINAAKRSIDVRIITPGIPDKKYVYAVTRSEYIRLLKYGVSIYEYTPGFIHAKNVVSDDLVATIGSINFDNRSFYHSYECGVLIHNSDTVIKMKKDFIKTQNFSEKITIHYIDKIPLRIRIKMSLYRALIPLL